MGLLMVSRELQPRSMNFDKLNRHVSPLQQGKENALDRRKKDIAKVIVKKGNPWLFMSGVLTGTEGIFLLPVGFLLLSQSVL